MKRFVVYLLALIVFGLCISLTLERGRMLPTPGSAVPRIESKDSTTGGFSGVEPSVSLVANLRENLQDPLTRLFVQLILIVLVVRVCGMVAAKLHEPAVIGEMIAGILLGPSLLGWLWPDVSAVEIQRDSLGCPPPTLLKQKFFTFILTSRAFLWRDDRTHLRV